MVLDYLQNYQNLINTFPSFSILLCHFVVYISVFVVMVFIVIVHYYIIILFVHCNIR